MRVGFPLVLEDKAVPVWVDCRPIDSVIHPPYPILWDEEFLHHRLPFYTDSGEKPNPNNPLNSRVRELIQNQKCLSFSGKDLPQRHTHDNKPYAVIQGDSYGLVLHLAIRSKLIDDKSDDCVLISGAVREDLPTRLRSKSLNNDKHSDLYHKWRYAHDNKYPLLLLKEDFDLLREELLKAYEKGELIREVARMDGAGDFVNWDNFKGNFDGWVKTHGCGRAYPLPISGHLWHDDSMWYEGLAKFLKLQPVGEEYVPSLGGAIAPQGGGEDTPSEPAASEETRTPLPGSVGNIYRVALPNEPEYLNDFLKRNEQQCSLPVYKDGMLDTALQFENDGQLFYNRAFNSDFSYKHVIVTGPTAGGKTRLAEALLLNCALEEGKPAMLIAPTRALVNEIYERLLKDLKSHGDTYCLDEENIVRSTGEYSQDDYRLRSGKFRIALVVNEKANIFMQPEFDLAGRLGLLVIDELHMLAHPQRGGVLDLLIAKARLKRDERAGGDKKLRIAVISTEPDVRKTGLETIFSAYNYETTASDIRPLCLSVENRPSPVVHSVVLYAQIGDRVEQRPIEILTFKGQADRLRPNDDASLLTTRDRIIKERNRFTAKKKINSDQRFPSETTLVEVIDKIAKEHKKVIVVCGSKDLCLRLARVEKNRRKQVFKKNGSSMAAEEIAMPSCGMLSSKTSSTLRELAAHGLYIHHADIPKVTREYIEDIFRNDAETSHPEIVFTTETLSYGVNLLADCVIVLGLRFPRTDIHEQYGDSELDFMTATEYHNILGRAGRSAKQGKASVLLESGNLDDESIDTLLGYYREQKPFYPMTFSKEDIAKAAREKINSLDDISYEAFRSVMDALRTAAGRNDYATLQKIYNIVEFTTFWGIASVAQHKASKILIGRTLEVAADYQKSMRLIEFSGDVDDATRKYRILPQAEALIDTGTRWSSVAPMRNWLKTLKSFDIAPNKPISVCLILPAFICSPDFWRIAKSFCTESEIKREVTDIDNKTNEVWDIVKEEIMFAIEGGDAELLNKIHINLDKFIEANKEILSVEHDQYRIIIFYKLFAALLLWIRGVSLDAIDPLSNKGTHVQQGNNFSMRYVDRAAWLAVMCYRFFGTFTDLVIAEHVRELPQLAQRLRVGLSRNGLPFQLDSNASARWLDRDEIAALLNAGLTAPAIASSKEPHAFVSKTLEKNEQLAQKAEGIARIVFDFYLLQLRKLSSVFDNESPEIWSNIRELYADMLGDKSVEKGSTVSVDAVANYNKCLNALLRARVSDETDNSGLEVISTRKETIINKSSCGLELRLRCLTPDESSQNLNNINTIVYVPWKRDDMSEELGDLIEITSFAALSLAALVGRNCVHDDELTQLIKCKSRIITIADIATMFSNTDTSAFTERLLEIIEL